MDDTRYITPEEAKKLFGRRGEFAVLDVREQEEFSRSHMLLASCAPLSRLELLVPGLVPCGKVPVVLVDSGEETVSPRAGRACRVLAAMGYSRPMALKGGMKAWLEKGYVEFTGVGALSKGFGEYVEEEQRTPRLEPREIKAVIDSGGKYAIIDVRPHEEFNNMNIPGAFNAPGCEVTYRFADLVTDDDTVVVINCAGRTRSIIGTQTLRNAGIPNKVVALKGGTMNWQLAGYSLEYGTALRTAPPSPLALDIARKRAADVAEKYGISFVRAETLGEWQAESESRTLYVFDVRQPEEYAFGHIPGSRNAQGGQLVQAADEYAAVRNARYVLVDDTEVRAVMTAHWLKQMGLPDVHVLRGGIGGSGFGKIGLEHGVEPSALPAAPEVRTISARLLRNKLAGDNPPLVINIGVGSIHRKGHVPGAVWVTRCYLELARRAYPGAGEIVLTSDSDIHARLGASDAAGLWPGASVAALSGGTRSWSAAEFPLERDMPTALCAEDDVWYKPYTDVHAGPEAMKRYFDWEFGLVERIRKDGDVEFSLVKSP
jgi:rhodanese-related sulfurtransferase